ncbi:MAG: exonuclease domain-containing protein [Cupriavidus sp.]|nr:exonuclease domain-containing protein [Cupriavidus sp.]
MGLHLPERRQDDRPGRTRRRAGTGVTEISGVPAYNPFVRPTERPTLTPFCMGLTHIEQASIDAARSWPAVAAELAEFARLHAGQCWGSWGAYDRRQIERESARHGLADPLAGPPHVNLKATFAKARKIKQVGMATALQIVGLELEGEHHRALSDARNIARLLPWALGGKRTGSTCVSVSSCPHPPTC